MLLISRYLDSFHYCYSLNDSLLFDWAIVIINLSLRESSLRYWLLDWSYHHHLQLLHHSTHPREHDQDLDVHHLHHHTHNSNSHHNCNYLLFVTVGYLYIHHLLLLIQGLSIIMND
jgi:hypothetical protein